MNISHLNIGIIHSLIGKNDGVSIVIDQTVNAMVNDLGIDLGNIFFLAAHTSPRFNAETDDVFWHKNDIHKNIIRYYNEEPPEDLDSMIHEKALCAKNKISSWVEKHDIDLIIAHNTSHPLNFVTAVGLGYYIEEIRARGILWPNLLVWWHDSYFERDRFSSPNEVVKKYLKYLPGTFIDGIAFINNSQVDLAKRLFDTYEGYLTEVFFRERVIVVPNTSSIDWEWEHQPWDSNQFVYPPQDNYNSSFFRDVGLINEINKKGFSLDGTIILLQHTRIVPRKKIELAIDFAFAMEKRFLKDGQKKCIALLVSGHSGDEQSEYKKFLLRYYEQNLRQYPDANVVFVFGEDYILSHRDIIVDKKYYNFYEIPSIIAAHGGIGTYFSEVEGFGNNLLEMISFGLPTVINKYDVYKSEIEHLGFMLPATENCILTDELVENGYTLLTNNLVRNKMVKHNLSIIKEKLDHKIIADKLKPLIIKMFTRLLK